MPVSLPLVHRPRGTAPRGRRLLGSRLSGDASDDYTTELRVEGQTFHAIVDTGSDVLALAAEPKLGCASHLDSSVGCDRTTPVQVTYGSGFWSGVECWRDVSLGGVVVPKYELSAIRKQEHFLTCTPREAADALRPGYVNEGIIGLSLDGLRGATNTSMPVLYALFAAHPRLPRRFGLQCCRYDALTGAGGGGALDVGGVAATHFSGELSYAAVVGGKWWGADLRDVRVGGASVLRDAGPSTAVDATGEAKYIVDSGTSDLLFLQDTFDALKAALIGALGPAAPPAAHGFWNGSDCAAVDAARMPPLELHLRAAEGSDAAGAAAVVPLRIPPSVYTRRQGRQLCLQVGPIGGPGNGILGQPLFEAYYVAHEMPPHPAPPTLGFAPIAGCAPAAAAANAAAAAAIATPAVAAAEQPHASAALLAAALGLVALLPAVVAAAALVRRRRRRSPVASPAREFWVRAQEPLLEE